MSGRFIPGEYRVNPYRIYDATLQNLPELEIYRDKVYVSGSTTYVSKRTITGKVHTALIATAGNEYPSFETYKQLTLQKAQGKVQSSDLDLGEDVGELRQTIEMLRSPLKKLVQFLISDRSRNLMLLRALASGDRKTVNWLKGRTGLASAETMSSTWLELRYGLRPLVMLVQDVIELVNKKSYAVWDPMKIRNARSTLTFSEQSKSSFDQTVALLPIRGDVLLSDKIQVNASIQYRQSSPDSLLDQLGLGPRYLPETVWALTQLSFVVDWIVSIGPWLASLRVNPKVEILGNTVGCKVVRTLSVESIDARFDQTCYWLRVPSSSAKCVYERYDRVVDFELSYLPRFTWFRTFDLFKAIDSISIIWQKLAALKKGS